MNAPAIIDSHVHLWNPARLRYAWLEGLPVLNRPFLPADYTAALAGCEVRKFIFVECGCEPAHNLAEVGWVLELSRMDRRLQGIVAQSRLEAGDAVRGELEMLAAQPLVKGIRRNLQAEPEEFCRQTKFIAGVRLLGEFQFTFDLCVRAAQLRAVTELAGRVPEVTFILDHFGKPDVRAAETRRWAGDLKSLAARPNVVCKISGLTTEADWNHWRPEDLRFYFDTVVECFGFDRLLFGSDWPVATLATTYGQWVETVMQLLPSAGAGDLQKLFQTNAERIYHV